MKKIMLATLLAGLMLITVWSSVTVGALSIGPVKIDTGNNVRPLGDDDGCLLITFRTLSHPRGVKVDTIKVIDENDPHKKITVTEIDRHGVVGYEVYYLDRSSTFRVIATKEGYKPIEFEIKCDKKRRIKEMQLEQLIPKGDKEDKLKTRKLQPIYNKDNGEYIMLSNPNERSIFNNDESKKELRSIIAPLTKKTKGEAVNIMKNAGFMGGKSADEFVQLKFDLNGKMYITGHNNYYRAPALFEEVLISNGIEVKRQSTSSEFTVESNINKQGDLTYWKWDGNVTTNFGGALNYHEKSITAEKLVREVKVVETDDNGYPKKIEYKFNMNGSFVFTKGITLKEWGNATKQWKEAKPHVSGDKFRFSATDTWDCEYKYDSNGNWIEMKTGPYTAKRTFKY